MSSYNGLLASQAQRWVVVAGVGVDDHHSATAHFNGTFPSSDMKLDPLHGASSGSEISIELLSRGFYNRVLFHRLCICPTPVSTRFRNAELGSPKSCIELEKCTDDNN
jgi:hypothetical protein